MVRWMFAGMVVVMALPTLQAQSEAEKAATLKYLESLQTPSGAFVVAAGVKEPTLRATSSALRAIKYFGGTVKNREAITRFVASCFDEKTGGFRPTPQAREPDVTTTAVGLMAVVELKMPLERYSGPAVKYLAAHAHTYEEIRITAAGLESIHAQPEVAATWLKEITAKRNDNGTYGKGAGLARDTGGTVVIELRLGAKVANPEAVLKAMRAGQRDDGGFGKADATGSDLETSYRVMRAFHMLKERPDEQKLRAFIRKCRNEDGGYGVSPGQKSSVSGTYFASIILHWLDEK